MPTRLTIQVVVSLAAALVVYWILHQPCWVSPAGFRQGAATEQPYVGPNLILIVSHVSLKLELLPLATVMLVRDEAAQASVLPLVWPQLASLVYEKEALLYELPFGLETLSEPWPPMSPMSKRLISRVLPAFSAPIWAFRRTYPPRSSHAASL